MLYLKEVSVSLENQLKILLLNNKQVYPSTLIFFSQPQISQKYNLL